MQEVSDKFADVTKEIFTFTTRDLREGEALYQYDGVLSQIANFIQTKDKIPMIRETEPSKPNSATQTDKPSTTAHETADAEAESSKPSSMTKPKAVAKPSGVSSTAQTTATTNDVIKAYLAPAIEKSGNARDPIAGPGRPNPRKHFGFKLSEARNEHDGHNILNAKELREWQCKLVAECAGTSAMSEVAENTNAKLRVCS